MPDDHATYGINGIFLFGVFLLLLGVVGLMTWLAGSARVLPNDDWISLV